MRLHDRRARANGWYGRRLAIETLERRDLLTMIRLVDWNTFNNPNDAADEADFATILGAIGTEVIEGNAQRLDIIAVQETDPATPPGNDSIGRLESVLDGLYTSTDYASIVSSVDGGGDSTGFVYDTSTMSLQEFTEVLPGSVTHKILRGKFRPESTLGESDFYVYSVHLKSGSTGSDESTRASEAAALRANADALGDGAHVLFVGDFNMHSSDDLAFTNLVAPGSAQLQDLAGPAAEGDWFNNAAFKHLHTQDAGVSMDDRFDIMFGTDDFFDGVGLEYVEDSYTVFGNNGTHTFDAAITTGTGAAPAVLAALVAVSDHLPIISDFEIVDPTPGVRIVETAGQTKVAEGGFTDTYSVVLNTVPSANVTVSVTPNGQLKLNGGVAGAFVDLLFTPGTALTPQQITVTADNDAAIEGTHSGLISHTSTSGDSSYNGLTIEQLTVAILDNDAPAIVINEIDADQTGTDTTEFIELYDGGIGNVSLNGMVLVFYNGNNDLSYRAISLSGSTDGSGFFLIGSSSIAGRDMTLPLASDNIQNGQDAVALYLSGSFPNGTAITSTNLLDAVVYDTGQADDAGLLPLLLAGQPQVNEHENLAAGTQSLSRVPDGGDPRETTTYVAQVPTPGGPNIANVPGVIITQTGSGVDVEEGGATDSFQVVLQTVPTASVTITIDPDGETDLGNGAGMALVLTFTVGNALTPQTVNVEAFDDPDIEGMHTSLITFTVDSADTGYDVVTVPSITADVFDNDFPPGTPIAITEIMYSPVSDETKPAVAEWIEIINNGASPYDLTGWKFDDEDSGSGADWGTVGPGYTLNPGQVAVFYDSDFILDPLDFKNAWNVPSGVLLIGVTWGSLGNTPGEGNEVLILLDDEANVMDTVAFDDATPWPTTPSDGPSIYLTDVTAEGNVGSNWARSVVGVDGAISPTGDDFLPDDVGSPGVLPEAEEATLPGDFNNDYFVDAADYTVWRNNFNTNFDLNGNGDETGDSMGVVDDADYILWAANYGDFITPPGGGGGLASSASLTSEPVAEPESDTAAVDEAIVVFDLSQVPQRASASTRALSTTSAAAAMDGSDLLLVLENSAPGSESGDESFDQLADSSDDDFSDVDQFFATLDDLELATAL